MITHGHHCSHTANGEWSLYIAIIHAPHGENMRWSCMLIMGDHGRSQPYKLTVQYHHIQWLSYLFSPYIPTISVHHTTKTNILDAYMYTWQEYASEYAPALTAPGLPCLALQFCVASNLHSTHFRCLSELVIPFYEIRHWEVSRQNARNASYHTRKTHRHTYTHTHTHAHTRTPSTWPTKLQFTAFI